MFTIIYENQHYKQFCSDYYFETVEEAYDYLLSNGYTNNNRIFSKITDWGGNQKAYIQLLKSHKSDKNYVSKVGDE